jgi:glycosyltransferase involved in cell wall biosynthesis
MRIAQVAPLHESVPPKLYGGTERVVSYLTEELVRMGHEVTLFATADSNTSAALRPGALRGLRLDPACRDPLPYHVAMLQEVVECAHEFDVVHFHIDCIHLPVVRAARLPAITTLHGRLDIPGLAAMFHRFPEAELVSISDAQRMPLQRARWAATVHHGLPRALLAPGAGGGGYLAFLGRISPEKGVDAAIRIARRAGMPLRIAAKIEKIDIAYYEQVIEPLLEQPGIDFVGEIDEARKARFLGEAAALLFPIDWPEPFGLVMIEAMACGTPVIAFARGAVPEVLRDSVSGWIVDGEAAAVQALGQLPDFDRVACRGEFEARFTAERMAREYLEAYRRVAARPQPESYRSAA